MKQILSFVAFACVAVLPAVSNAVPAKDPAAVAQTRLLKAACEPLTSVFDSPSSVVNCLITALNNPTDNVTGVDITALVNSGDLATCVDMSTGNEDAPPASDARVYQCFQELIADELK